jgi:hypothetical protein
MKPTRRERREARKLEKALAAKLRHGELVEAFREMDKMPFVGKLLEVEDVDQSEDASKVLGKSE